MIENVTNTRKRDVNIDTMKAIGIMLVILGHIYHNSYFIYLFHMPLFFILSGSAMNYSPNGLDIKKRFYSIVVPYFIFSIVSFTYWFLIESKFRPVNNDPIFVGLLGSIPIKAQQFINIFLAFPGKSSFAYNVVLWFLPCIFLANITYSMIKGSKLEFVYILLLIVFYYLFENNLPCLPWYLNIAIIAVPLISVGYHTYNFATQILTYHWGGGKKYNIILNLYNLYYDYILYIQS